MTAHRRQRNAARVALDDMAAVKQHVDQHAACAEIGTDPFFPDDDDPAAAETRQAKQVCSRCPVQTDCLRFAVQTRQEHGIWGGATPHERQNERRRANRRERRQAA